ncbi:unnamed protein product, partial [Effrenium voratum]
KPRELQPDDLGEKVDAPRRIRPRAPEALHMAVSFEEMEDVEDVPSRPSSHEEPEPAAAKQLPSLKRLKRFTGVQTPDWTSGATKNLKETLHNHHEVQRLLRRLPCGAACSERAAMWWLSLKDGGAWPAYAVNPWALTA